MRGRKRDDPGVNEASTDEKNECKLDEDDSDGDDIMYSEPETEAYELSEGVKIKRR